MAEQSFKGIGGQMVQAACAGDFERVNRLRGDVAVRRITKVLNEFQPLPEQAEQLKALIDEKTVR